VYSVSFENRQLRKSAVCARVAYDAAAEAHSRPGKAGSYAKWCSIPQARRSCGQFRIHHAQWRNPALQWQRQSLALTTAVFRTFFVKELGTSSLSYVNDGAPLAAHCLRSSVDFERVAADKPLRQFSGAVRVSCCSRMSFSLAQVSAQSIPPPTTPVQMSCTHPRANFCFRSSLFLHTLTCVTRATLSQVHIDAR
jgi:hypothetical protein